MVRPLNVRHPVGWSALLAMGVAGAALLWHLLACVESPMAFSPDGKQLALVTCEPYNGDETMLVAGTHAYRLFRLNADGKLHLVEQTTQDMLTGPAFSPDGRQLCYLRMPLLTAENMDRLKKCVDAREAATKQPEFDWLAGRPPESPAPTPPPATADECLPPAEDVQKYWLATERFPLVPVRLDVRDAESDAVLKRIDLQLPILAYAEGLLPASYATIRTSFSPDGKTIFCVAGGTVTVIDPEKNAARVVATAAEAAAVSPDGRAVAVLTGHALGLIEADGSAARWVRWDHTSSPCGLAWTGDDRLAVLDTAADSHNLIVHFVKRDLVTASHATLAAPDHGKMEADNAGALALSPDGQHVVVAFKNTAFFFEPSGKLLKQWVAEGAACKNNESLAQPVFSPDGQRVAVKVMQGPEGSNLRAAAVAFFSPAGEELSRVAIPAIDPTTTQPAKPPTDQPAGAPTTQPAKP